MNHLSFEVVYKNIPHTYKKQILQLWDNVLPKSEQLKRIDQVVVVAKNSNNEIVGVTTVYKDIFKPKNELFYFYRMYVDPKYRNRIINRNGNNMTTITKEYLRDLQEYEKPKGIIAVLENKKISDKIMLMLGWEPLNSPINEKMWISKF